MSQGEPVGISTARNKAERLLSMLSPSCERIEIAGSIRRNKPLIRDIELVAIPRRETRDGGDLWGTQVEVDCLDETLQALRASGALPLRAVENHRADGSVETSQRDGESYKALVFDGMPVDLFIVHPGKADWGVIFTIRTGPAEWSHRLVTDCQRYLRRVAGGRLYRAGEYVSCPEEADFLAALGQPWVDPADRSADRVAIGVRA